VLVDFAGMYPQLALESPDRREDLVTLRYVSLLPNLPGSSSSVIIGFLDHGSFELWRVYGSHHILVRESIWIPLAGSKGNGIFSFLLHFVVSYCISIIKDGIHHFHEAFWGIRLPP
jgi:hypothetical protein